MPDIAVGYRRLFEVVSCMTEADEPIAYHTSLENDVHLLAYIGKAPTMSVMPFSLDTDGLIRADEEGHVQFHTRLTPLNDDEAATMVYTEILAWRVISVDQKTFDALQPETPEAEQRLFALVGIHRSATKSAADIFAATVGLRLHKQFVIKQVGEGIFAFRNESQWKYQTFSRIGEVVFPFTLTIERINKQFAALADKLDEKDRDPDARALGWLVEGWTERAPMAKFLAYFIALEIVLQRFATTTAKPLLTDEASAIRKLVMKYAGTDRSKLIKYFDKNIPVPEELTSPLQARFETAARLAGMLSKEADIESFSRFREMRNDLVHEGDQAVRLAVADFKGEMNSLEGLAERYINWALFGDAKVYTSFADTNKTADEVDEAAVMGDMAITDL